MFILLSFWCSGGYARVTLNLLGTFIAAIMFMAFAEYAPFAYVPRLVHYYEATLVLSWLAFIGFVVNNCLEKYAEQFSAPYDVVLEMMSIAWIRMLLAIDLVNIYVLFSAEVKKSSSLSNNYGRGLILNSLSKRIMMKK